MQYTNSDDILICEWGACSFPAATRVFNSDLSDSSYVCTFHRKVAAINLEKHDRVHAPDKQTASRPGDHLPPPQPPRTPVARPSSDRVRVEAWEQEAAQGADRNAVPIEPLEVDEPSALSKLLGGVQRPVIGDIPKPRRLK